MKEKKVEEGWVEKVGNEVGYNYDSCHRSFSFRENAENDKSLCSVFSLFLRVFSLKKIKIFKTNTFSNAFFVFFENENRKW